ncbi:hypothetical protein [Nitrospira sp. BLG_2]|uniref:hypothetical protein n=1 Tax=Nitrospira sp. BLG_2 TaxID=3397507 RepID=UPI003B99821B
MPTQQEVSETTLGVRMPVWLKEAIQECADAERRTPSNWVRLVLEEVVEKRRPKKKT